MNLDFWGRLTGYLLMPAPTCIYVPNLSVVLFFLLPPPRCAFLTMVDVEVLSSALHATHIVKCASGGFLVVILLLLIPSDTACDITSRSRDFGGPGSS